MVVNDTNAQRELVGGVQQVVEHTQEENQQGTTTTLPKVLVLQMSVKVEGRQWEQVEKQVEIWAFKMSISSHKWMTQWLEEQKNCS